MKKKVLSINRKNFFGQMTNKDKSENGSAILIALFVMLLLLGFVALAVTRTTSETVASSNDEAETRAFEAAHASLEVITRNFDKIFEQKLNPETTDIDRIKGQLPPGFTNYTFQQDIDQTQTTAPVIMTGQQFQGLNALRDKWQINTTATDNTTGVQVALRREFFNNRIPIFQFGIFYDDDLEFHPGPRFDFGGRVHSNGNLFLMAQDGLYFSSKVTAVGEIFTDVARNSDAATRWGDPVYIKNASGTYVRLRSNMGSVLTSPTNGSNVFAGNADMPVVYKNASWISNQNLFQGNLLYKQKPLELPIRIYNNISGTPLDYIELIKRGKNVGDLWNSAGTLTPVTTATADATITSSERFYNKTGIRISLADSKAKLPGCALGTGTAPVLTPCGVRLDGDDMGGIDRLNSNVVIGTNPGIGEARGYVPRPMTGSPAYQATEVNGERFYLGVTGRELWIKIEIVGINPATGVYVAPRDITEDILSLGVTEPPIYVANELAVSGYGTATTDHTEACVNNADAKDCRSIVKLQRFVMPGVAVSASDTDYMTTFTWNSKNYNLVMTDDCNNSTYTTGCSSSVDDGFSDNTGHKKAAVVDNTSRYRRIVPFPINMFDTREGLYYEGTSTFNPTSGSNYGTKVPWNGVMSMVDIDIANLRKLLYTGAWDGKFPTGTPFAVAAGHTLRSSDFPNANGWVMYISDRRGDGDFDGEYDMEDVFGNNDGILQAGEDVNKNGSLQADYTNEASRYTGSGAAEIPDIAATVEHKFYRRGVRLINGQTLPGVYTDPINTKGFTVASENGIYILGNYNAISINSVGTPTPAEDYNPQGTANHIPASIAADAITILSPSWSDSRSFRYPFSLSNRPASETFLRFAMLSGDTLTSKDADPNQGGGDQRMSGGVHNFMRFLEDWGDDRVNYAGSMINLYNSHNNNGTFKCCSMVYSPPARNWVFDISFLDPNRLPPGTPFFQTIQLTGFQRIN